MNSQRMQELISSCGRIFVGYLVAGYPNREESIALARSCCENGLDILEIGFPARNPSADGEVIRHALEKVDLKLGGDLTYWRELRAAVEAPIWIMGYHDDLVTGDAYLKLAQEGLYDVLVVPDMDNGKRVELSKKLAPLGVDVIGFINPMSAGKELSACFEHLPLIYHQLYCGPTGETNDSQDYLPLLHKAREASNAKVFAGFGISTPERAQELLHSGFDGVIVGSAIMKQLSQSVEATHELIKRIHNAVRSV